MKTQLSTIEDISAVTFETGEKGGVICRFRHTTERASKVADEWSQVNKGSAVEMAYVLLRDARYEFNREIDQKIFALGVLKNGGG